jgi:hypothetical protein
MRPSSGPPSDPWWVLGEHLLSVDSNLADAIHACLTSSLKALNLPVEFQNRLMDSAQSLSAQLLPGEPSMELQQLHLTVYLRQYAAPPGKSWGFFRIDRVGRSAEGAESPDRSVEFYLFSDGG